uniref:Protein kinase domain-containing protein n=1 Tax=Labrus bergylta TaxID=56723 RepID=A0A3Q3F1Q0_9LABR
SGALRGAEPPQHLGLTPCQVLGQRLSQRRGGGCFLYPRLTVSMQTPCSRAHVVETPPDRGYGVVVKCRNTITEKCVAIKVNKNKPNIYHQARKEIDILKQLRCLDPETCNIVLYHYMEVRLEKTLPITEVKDVLYQLSIALSHLSSIGIVHADLKPENVIVVDRHQKPLRVKLIDFGLASRVSDCEPGMCVQTTWYRAPEVCLHSEFNGAIDMWSLGLTAAELAVGYPLYPGNLNYDVLRFIIATQGQLPDHVLEQGHATCNYFNQQRYGPQRWRFKTPSLDDLEKLMEVNRGHNSDHGLLVDLIKRMMHLDQDQRIKPQEVLQHPFLTGSLPQNSCPEVRIDMPDQEAICRVQRGNTSHAAESENVGWFSGITERIRKTFQSYFLMTPHRGLQRGNVTLAADSEDVQIQPGTKTENVSWFRVVGKLITDTFQSCFHKIPSMCRMAV